MDGIQTTQGRESNLDSKTEKLLRTLGIPHFKAHGSAMQRSGIPDFIGCWKDRMVCIENKREDGTGTLKPLQYAWLSLFAEQGALCVVSDNIRFTELALNSIDYNAPYPFHSVALDNHSFTLLDEGEVCGIFRLAGKDTVNCNAGNGIFFADVKYYEQATAEV